MGKWAKNRVKLKKAGDLNVSLERLSKRVKQASSGTWPEYWKEKTEQFHNLSIFPTSYSVPEKRKCA